MRFAKIAIAAVVLGLVQLVFGWRLAVAGATADVLFILVVYATIGLRPAEGVPIACAVGLWADLLVGGRLGLLALGYGIGARLVGGLRPLVGRWGAGHRGGAAGRAVATLVLVLAGAAAAHGVAATVGYVAGGAHEALGARFLRAIGISFLTSLSAPVVWPVLAVTVGELDGRYRGRAGAVEA